MQGEIKLINETRGHESRAVSTRGRDATCHASKSQSRRRAQDARASVPSGEGRTTRPERAQPQLGTNSSEREGTELERTSLAMARNAGETSKGARSRPGRQELASSRRIELPRSHRIDRRMELSRDCHIKPKRSSVRREEGNALEARSESGRRPRDHRTKPSRRAVASNSSSKQQSVSARRA